MSEHEQNACATWAHSAFEKTVFVVESFSVELILLPSASEDSHCC